MSVIHHYMPPEVWAERRPAAVVRNESKTSLLVSNERRFATPNHHGHLRVIEDRGWWYVEDVRTGRRSERQMWAGGAELVKWQLALRNLVNE